MKIPKKISLLILIGVLPIVGIAQAKYEIETTDITNFWKAFDALEKATSKEDSITIIQEQYIEQSTTYFKEFIKVRNFTAEEYVEKIGLYPKFWTSVRPLTETIENRKAEIENVFAVYRKMLPNFKQPNVCFAIGCLRTGGTVVKDLLLIGSEIAGANQAVDKSEMTGWLESVIGNSGDIVAMVAHETIHTQQFDSGKIKWGRSFLLQQTLTEGIADFFTVELLGKNINQSVFDYGEKNKCLLKKEFLEDLQKTPKKINKWLYNGSKSKNRPADLGYFIGYEIAKSYYDKSENKEEAIANLLDMKQYKRVFKKSRYEKESCN